jgi:hypothetical protein
MYVGASQVDNPAVGIAIVPSLYTYYYFFILNVRLSPFGTAATTGLLYHPRMIDDDDCGAVGGMEIGR